LELTSTHMGAPAHVLWRMSTGHARMLVSSKYKHRDYEWTRHDGGAWCGVVRCSHEQHKREHATTSIRRISAALMLAQMQLQMHSAVQQYVGWCLDTFPETFLTLLGCLRGLSTAEKAFTPCVHFLVVGRRFERCRV
jgi:hypothetical protein